jgi:hypothetical protein
MTAPSTTGSAPRPGAARRRLARSAAWLPLALLLAGPAAARATEPCPDGLDLDRVLDVHGARALADVRALDFTFRVNHGGTEIDRRWHWELATNQVTLSTVGEDGSALLLAFQSPPPADASEAVQQADRWFINDRYWLLFPHRLAWDAGVDVTSTCDPQPLPIGDGQAPRFTATYGAQGGYTPGDAYDFWVLPDGRISEWSYRRGNAADPTLSVRFADYTQLGPLLLSLTRTGPDGSRFVWFTDVTVTTAQGSFSPPPQGEEDEDEE